MLARYKCLDCGFEYECIPQAEPCPKCGHDYVCWTNYEQWREMMDFLEDSKDDD